MRAKKCWEWVIVSFSILVVLLSTQQITGETDLSAKDKETDSILAALRKSEVSTEWVWHNEKEILQGLEGVSVLVETINPKAEEYGLTRQALQTDTELQLRQYGIKVLTREERLSTLGKPCLYINVNVMIREEIPMAAVSMLVELQENVLLLREPKRICFGASTWRKGNVVSVGVRRIKDIRGYVKDYVNEFINDYLAANPKDGSTKKKGSIFDNLKKPKDN